MKPQNNSNDYFLPEDSAKVIAVKIALIPVTVVVSAVACATVVAGTTLMGALFMKTVYETLSFYAKLADKFTDNMDKFSKYIYRKYNCKK